MQSILNRFKNESTPDSIDELRRDKKLQSILKDQELNRGLVAKHLGFDSYNGSGDTNYIHNGLSPLLTGVVIASTLLGGFGLASLIDQVPEKPTEVIEKIVETPGEIIEKIIKPEVTVEVDVIPPPTL